MPLFKTRSSKIEPMIVTTDIGTLFAENNQPKVDHVFFNVASTDTHQSSKTKRIVLTERMDDPEEVCELSPFSMYYRRTGGKTMDLNPSDGPREFYRRSMDFCRTDFPPPPNFLPTKKPSVVETREGEEVWKVQRSEPRVVDESTTIVYNRESKGSPSKWQLRDVDKMSHLRHKCSIPSSVQNPRAVQRWITNPDRFYNYITSLRLAAGKSSGFTGPTDERLKHFLLNKEAHRVSFAHEELVLSCVQENSKDDLEFVLRHSDVDINICFNARELSPLHLASLYGYIDCVQVLLRYGANVNYLDPCGQSALYKALSNHHFEVAVLLIEAGADIGQFTKQKLREFEKMKKATKKYSNDLET